MKEQLELRMYFFVNYQLMGIQKGIQCGHAALEYASKFGNDEIFMEFIRIWKTWIILDGGTTNETRGFDGNPLGTLDQIGDSLLENDIQFSYFKEPDLNNALTSLCFIADERVWNYTDYPNFVDYLIQYTLPLLTSQKVVELKMMPIEELREFYYIEYQKWVDFMGGDKNIFLRELIKDKKLA